MTTWQQRAEAFRKSRAAGQSPEKRAEVRKVLEAATDWSGTCRKCGVHLEGTLKELREHVCGIQGS